LQQLNPRGFVIVEARLSIPLSKLLADIKKNIGRGSVLQVFSASSIISREHLLCAYINACMSFEEKTNIASTVGLEMLLFAAMSRQIEESLRRVGAVDGERIVVFADSPKVLNSVKGCLKGAKRFSPSRKASLIAAKRLGLREIDSKSVISAVALSRVCS
jgi:tRNA threonylcarbamoyladenosine modification (KEOPS) complex Cgi121 subunit